MAKNRLKYLLLTSAMLLTACGATHLKTNEKQYEDATMNTNKQQPADDAIVRLSKIQIHPEYLHDYLQYAIEVGETSLLTEPGVLTMYAMQDVTDSCSITILESYASQEAYNKHIASEHFQKYKKGTLHMVKSLELCDQHPLNPKNKLTNSITE